MLVYGDRSRPEMPRTMLARIVRALDRAVASPAGVARHDWLTDAFLEAAALMQGVADHEWECRGFDDASALQDASAALLLALARALAQSWHSAFTHMPRRPFAALQALHALPLPGTISVRTPEGHAFYAVYPEAYLAAAERTPWPSPPIVIGIRSIGTGLGAMVAAGSGSSRLITLRPCGHPFARTVRVSDGLRHSLARPTACFAIVDEGPGLSGSSFGAVADLLESVGVAPGRIKFFPSHRGALGPRASPPHRERWLSANRQVTEFDELCGLTAPPAHRFTTWVEDCVGGTVAPPEEVSGGAWRRLFPLPEPQWPPVHAAQERRKYVVRTDTGTWLLKFAGLGAHGVAKLKRARALAAAGFCVEAKALRRGFLIERFCLEGRPLLAETCDRQRLVETLAAYLAFRAASFPAAPHEGAGLATLVSMAHHNVTALLGASYAAALSERLAVTPALEQAVRRIHTDNRLHAWEWLSLPDGRLLKTDAVDHDDAHDLIGCQDIAWDVAGAITELRLTADEAVRLCALLALAGQPVDRRLLDLFLICYAAFQAGHWSLAHEVAALPERYRIKLTCRRYEERLRALSAVRT